jgi:hypothetical protein
VHLVAFRPEFDSFEFLTRDLLRITNPIITIDSAPAVHGIARRLYTVHLGDYNKCGNVPSRYYAAANRLLRSGLEEAARTKGVSLSDRGAGRRPYAVYLSREGLRYRSVANENDILQEITAVCDRHGADMVTFDLRRHPMEPFERFALFHNASMVIGPHGGAGYHVYFCRPGTPFIEVFSLEHCINLENLAKGIPLRYYPIATPSLISHKQRKFKIKPKWVRISVQDAWDHVLSSARSARSD